MSVSSQVHQGLRWGSAGIASIHGVRFVTTAVLARLLAPELFGLVAMAQITIQMIGVLGRIGLFDAYVQRIYEDPAQERLAAGTTFAVMAVLDLALFALVFACAPFVATFFQSEEVVPVLRWLVVSLLIDPFLTTPQAVLRKRLAFDAIAQASIAGAFTNGVLAIGAAFWGLGVWSLVVGQLGAQAVQAGVLIVRAGWRPTLSVSWSHARQLFGYGKYLWAFAVVSAVGDSLDRLVIGRSLGAAPLGIYGLAYNVARLPSALITNLVNQISFPAFSRLQRDPNELRRAFMKALSHVFVLAMPVGVGLMAVASDLVLTVYGDKWSAAVPVLRVLAFYGTALSVAAVTGPVFQAIGRPQVLLYTSLLHHTLLVGFLVLLARHGAVGIAWAVLLPMLSSMAIALTLVVHFLELPARPVWELLLRGGAASGLMWLAVRLFDGWLDATLAWPVPLSLAASVAVGVAVYGLATRVLNRAVLDDLRRTVRGVLARDRRPAAPTLP